MLSKTQERVILVIIPVVKNVSESTGIARKTRCPLRFVPEEIKPLEGNIFHFTPSRKEIMGPDTILGKLNPIIEKAEISKSVNFVLEAAHIPRGIPIKLDKIIAVITSSKVLPRRLASSGPIDLLLYKDFPKSNRINPFNRS